MISGARIYDHGTFNLYANGCRCGPCCLAFFATRNRFYAKLRGDAPISAKFAPVEGIFSIMTPIRPPVKKRASSAAA